MPLKCVKHCSILLNHDCILVLKNKCFQWLLSKKDITCGDIWERVTHCCLCEMVCQYGKCRKASYDGVDLGRRLLSLRRLFFVVVVVLRDQRNCVKETELETPLKVITSKRITQIVVANFVKSTKQNQTNRCKTRSEEKQSHRSGEKKTHYDWNSIQPTQK